jgi:hypothetical protein
MTVGIIYDTTGSIFVVNIILLDSENISFDASLVMYINNNNIFPIIITNRMYENEDLYSVPAMIHTFVCIISIYMAIGSFICVNMSYY